MTLTVSLILLVVAIVLFVVAGFDLAHPKDVNLVALGLAFGFGSFLPIGGAR